ncbi:hypothetical protein [Paraglaciecola sp. MB-3u-78]|uniref:hypothetical protein n=1 Tax=Paraglaciecola sp. MB-3u-78 TaxID=2058332 RepID=UPI0012FF4351|nr:hypothetical protein [Paraglaciecola sp. MB-3u-78]
MSLIVASVALAELLVRRTRDIILIKGSGHCMPSEVFEADNSKTIDIKFNLLLYALHT